METALSNQHSPFSMAVYIPYPQCIDIP